MNRISLEIALKYTEMFQREYPKKDLHEITEALANEIEQAIQVEAKVIVKTAETLDRFIGEPVKYIDINICKEKVAQIRNLFCEGHTSEQQLQDIEIYFEILINIMLNERRAFNDAVKRMHKEVSRFSE